MTEPEIIPPPRPSATVDDPDEAWWREMMLAAQPANPRHRGTGRFRPREAVTDRLAITLLMALAYTPAHAQPSSWQSHSDGYLTRYQGTDGNGEPWTGTSYQSGFTTYFDANGPHGEQQHCRSWQQGWQTINECD